MTITVCRATNGSLSDVQALLNEYYEALQIRKRDTPDETASFLAASNSPNSQTGFWLAYDEKRPIGCVILRQLSPEEKAQAGLSEESRAGEIKRLFVRDDYRGQRLADKLMDALEDFAVDKSIRWLYLDSHSLLVTAIKLYTRRGYVACERYNNNIQADVFLRRSMSTLS